MLCALRPDIPKPPTNPAARAAASPTPVPASVSLDRRAGRPDRVIPGERRFRVVVRRVGRGGGRLAALLAEGHERQLQVPLLPFEKIVERALAPAGQGGGDPWQGNRTTEAQRHRETEPVLED